MKTATFFDLKIPAKTRLQLLRNALANHPIKYPHCPAGTKPKTWRDIRGTTHKSLGAYTGALSPGFNGTDSYKTPIWYCHTGPAFRNECFADECEDSRIKHQGWCTNENGETCRDGSGLARGIVGSLTHGRFIAGYHWGDNGERAYFPDVFDNAQSAAAMADEHARIFAELQQADNAKWNAARDLEIAIEDNLTRLRECIGLRNYRQCKASARSEALELCDSIRGMRDSLQTDFADYI